MRALSSLCGETVEVTAVVDHYSHTRCYNPRKFGRRDSTHNVLLRDIAIGGKVYDDHVWIRAGGGLTGLLPGDQVTLTAVVKPYSRRDGSTDCGLSRVRDLKVRAVATSDI